MEQTEKHHSFWVTQTARITEVPANWEEISHKGERVVIALFANPALEGCSVATQGQFSSGRSGDVRPTPIEFTLSAIIQATGMLDAAMQAAPAFMAAFKSGHFEDGWEWVGSRVRMLPR